MPPVLDPSATAVLVGARRLWSARRPAVPHLVARRRLVAVLADPCAPPLTLLTAPAGYGKTTVLREWVADDARPVGWATLDARDDDPAHLTASLERALAVAGEGTSVVMVVDDLHAIRGRAAFDALVAFANDLPADARLVLASRVEPPLPIARLRAQGMVDQLGPGELAMTRAEAAMLFRAAGRELDRATLDRVLWRTEGWPAALSLAALFMRDQPPAMALARLKGADRLVAGYVRDEVLAGLSAAELAFALQTAICETLTAPLCDAVAGRPGSAAALARFAAAGLLVPLDRTGDRYRYRRLVGETLRAILARTAPALEHELHRRAGEWHRQAGDEDGAIRHALSAGDVRGAAALAGHGAADAVAHGRAAAIERRLGWFDRDQLADQPALAVTAATCELIRGRGQQAEQLAATASPAGEPAVRAAAALLRAAFARDGLARMERTAADASALLDGDSPWRAVGCLLVGVASHLAGDRARAAAQFDAGARRAALSAPGVHALCLTQLAILAAERGEWDRASVLGARARAQVDRHGLAGEAPYALVLAASAVIRAHGGAVDAAREDLAAGAELADTLTGFPAWYELELELLLARAALRLGDVEGARRLDRCERRVADDPESAVLRAWVADLREQAAGFAAGGAATATSLTAAELRILRFLPSHLSFREIAERASVSANTVKTQVGAVYRKLGVGSRSDAVARARACGLLDA